MSIFTKIFTQKKNVEQVQPRELYLQTGKVTNNQYFFGEERKTIRNLIAPNGGNTSPFSYMTIHDAGIDIYYCGLYIDKLPKRLTIATSFSFLLNYMGVTSNIFIDPLLDESITRVNKRIDTLGGEIYGAQKSDNGRNRVRELVGKFENAERWAKTLDSGENTLFEVSFLFLLESRSIESLQLLISDFEGEAKKRGIELAACYGAHAEAYLASLPLNRIPKVKAWSKLAIGVNPIKKHILDKYSLSTIYNHTNSEFFHANGVPIGRNLYSGLPCCLDPYDPTHHSYGIIVAGMSGQGKSATMKQLYSRLTDFDETRFALIDYEPLPDGRCGEYSPFVEAVGGKNYLISNKGKNRINLFEVNEELEYERISDIEYRTLHLSEKIVDITNILLVIATSVSITRNVSFQAETLSRMSSIISRVVKTIFQEKSIFDGEPDSLYEDGENGTFSFGSGRKRKRLPQMRDFYMELLKQRQKNIDPHKEDTYSLMLDVFEDNVQELYYCPLCLKEFTREEYEMQTKGKNNERWCTHENGKMEQIYVIKGTKAYFDTQSNLKIDTNLPCTNIDLTQVPESDRPMLTLVAQNFIQENFIKTNSTDPKKARRLLYSNDEAHKILKFEEARIYENSLFRTARKRHVAPVLIMQSIADLSKYNDTEEIIKNTETFILFKHSYKDREYIKSSTNITDSQIETILNLGGDERSEKKRPGEFCLIDVPTKRVVFIQADYLVDSEQYIVETDTEIIAQMHKERG